MPFPITRLPGTELTSTKCNGTLVNHDSTAHLLLNVGTESH